MNGFRPPTDRLAELIVDFAANVQPDQLVSITSEPGKEELTRAVARRAYERGARYVDVLYLDPYVRRVRIEHAAEETLGYEPPWYGARMLALGEVGAARIGLAGSAAPGLLDDLDPVRAAKARPPAVRENLKLIDDRSTNWTGVPCPTRPWAAKVHPDLPEEEAYERLWEQIVHICRLDEPDPPAAWGARMETLGRVARVLSETRFEELHFEGPGTDLTIGLLPTSTWFTAEFARADGLRHMVNLPSEEIFTGPDPQRADGVVSATMPLEYFGSIVEGLRVTFEDGRAVGIEAKQGEDVIRQATSVDDGAVRLGEVALVDREGRIGPLETVFFDTLIDENAASHLALGNAYSFSAGESDQARLNQSAIHVDFMIGSNDVDVTGSKDGRRVPVLRDGTWQL